MLYFIIGFGCFTGGFLLGYFLGIWNGIWYQVRTDYEYSEKGNPYN